MANKKKAAEGGAEAVEKVAGKKAVVVEAAVEPKPRTQSTKTPKLASKNKSRLPRREKKAKQKADKARQSVS